MKQAQKTKPIETSQAKQDFKGGNSTQKVRFDPSDDDDPMLTTDCKAYFAGLTTEEQQNMRQKAGGELKLDWAFDSFDDMVKKLEDMAEAERNKLMSALDQKIGTNQGGMICFCGSPSCSIGEFVPISEVRKYRGY